MKKINAESYIKADRGLVSVEDLTPADREVFAVWLKSAYLNELFRGQGKIVQEKEKT